MEQRELGQRTRSRRNVLKSAGRLALVTGGVLAHEAPYYVGAYASAQALKKQFRDTQHAAQEANKPTNFEYPPLEPLSENFGKFVSIAFADSPSATIHVDTEPQAIPVPQLQVEGVAFRSSVTARVTDFVDDGMKHLMCAKNPTSSEIFFGIDPNNAGFTHIIPVIGEKLVIVDDDLRSFMDTSWRVESNSGIANETIWGIPCDVQKNPVSVLGTPGPDQKIFVPLGAYAFQNLRTKTNG